jgi:hypothetical protein
MYAAERPPLCPDTRSIRDRAATNKERRSPRLRAKTSPLVRGLRLSHQGNNSQADEGRGVFEQLVKEALHER